MFLQNNKTIIVLLFFIITVYILHGLWYDDFRKDGYVLDYTKNSDYQEQVNELRQDKWLQRIEPFLRDETVSKSRNHFMLTCAFYYALLELENLSEKDVESLMQDGFLVEEKAKKWRVNELATFIDRVAMVSSTRMLEHIILIVRNSEASDEVKESIIHEMINQNVTESWNLDGKNA